MINVSNEFNKTMAQRTDFTENAVITFVDGTVLELTEKDFTTSNNAIIDGAGSNGLPVGVAMCRSIQIELDNHDDRFSTYDFFGAKIRLYLTFKLSETTEKIEEGIFTVVSPETYGQTVIISAVDDMYKADKSYSTDLSFPANAGSVLRDVCSYCDIPLLSTSFDNDDFFIESKPDANIPCRQIIGYIAMISGGNARINRQGQLEIMHYDTQAFQKENLNGGVFQPWNSEEIVSGGSFNPWTESDVYSGGTFTDKYPYHILGYWKNIKVDTDDVVITGVSIKSGENTYLSGDTGYVLSFENTFITGKEQMVADYLGQKLIGIKFRKFEGDLVSNPLIEFMDPALIIDRKGNIYQTYITDVDFNFLGLTTLKNSAENAVRNSSKYYSESVKTLVEAKRLYEVEKNAREIAVENLANQLATSSGLYMTVESQLDGSNVYYMHDKPTLSESIVVWKLTALAFGISTDGGKTYPYGFTVDGETITRLLYADGIDVKNLVVGENVTMGPNAKISWSNVMDKSDVAEKSDIPSKTSQLTNDSGLAYDKDIPNKTSQLTNDSDFAYTEDIPTKTSQLTNDSDLAYAGDIPSKLSQLTNDSGFITDEALPTDEEICDIILENRGTIITKEYIGTLKVVAGSVAAENITGEEIIGKKFTSNVFIGSWNTETSIDGGKIRSEVVGGSYPLVGTYVQINAPTIEIVASSMECNIDYSKISFSASSGALTSELTYSKLNIGGISSAHTELTVSDLTVYASSSNKAVYGSDSIDFYKYGTITADYLTLGDSTSYLGFFGGSKRNTQVSISTISSTSTATASTIATKVNELIDALKKYNLLK